MDLENPKVPDGEDKFMAAVGAVCLIVAGIVVIFMTIGLFEVLWNAGIINAVVIIGALSGLLAIGRALYHVILEKDIL